jgi:hypothetical protein
MEHNSNHLLPPFYLVSMALFMQSRNAFNIVLQQLCNNGCDLGYTQDTGIYDNGYIGTKQPASLLLWRVLQDCQSSPKQRYASPLCRMRKENGCCEFMRSTEPVLFDRVCLAKEEV